MSSLCQALNIVDGETTTAAHFLHVGLRSRYQDLLVRKQGGSIENLELAMRGANTM